MLSKFGEKFPKKIQNFLNAFISFQKVLKMFFKMFPSVFKTFSNVFKKCSKSLYNNFKCFKIFSKDFK